MDDAALVRGCHSGSDLARDVEKLGRFEWTAMNALRQRFAFAVLHDDVRCTVRFADFVDRRDVRMANGGRTARFAHETRAAIAGRQIFRAKNFERDSALQTRIAREVNRSHPTFAEYSDDLESVERLRDFSHWLPKRFYNGELHDRVHRGSHPVAGACRGGR